MAETIGNSRDLAKRLKKVAAFGLIGLTGTLTGCTVVPHNYSEKDAEAKAKAKYAEAWKSASPAGKYVMQYLAITRIEERAKDVMGDTDDNYSFLFNDGCLQNTAYDIAGGKINGSFRGLFSRGSIEGRVPTAAANAYVDNKQPDVLIIQSGHASSRDLRFSGVIEGDQLKPLDQQTKNVLATNDCNSGYQGHKIVPRYDDSSSPWVNTVDPAP